VKFSFCYNKGYAIHAFLGCNIIVIQKQLTGIASLIKKMSGKNASVINSTYCSNKAVVCSWNNNVDHTSEVLNSLDRQITISIDPILHRPSAKIHFPLRIQIMSNIFMFISNIVFSF
jgi:hypothetical protein